MATKKRPTKSRRSKKKAPSRSRVSPHRKRQKRGILAAVRETVSGPIEPISNDRLLDFLSEFLAVERGGIQLYSTAIERSTDPSIREEFEEFLIQTQRHEQLLTDVIVNLNGDPNYKSAGALVQENLTQTMLNLDVPPHLRELRDAENILLAETKDHLDWEFLDQLKSMVEDDAQELLSDIINEVEDEEDHHVSFAQKAVTKLAIKVATSEDSEMEQEVA